ncbi:hypothetical protein BDA96_09G025200 [Sorghum bicolor]|uniref:Uncharacterized protein n=2 Tax=Sorghum bicolor TaxID=4558 RepID=A0A921U2S3_SORBI|nr:hypothetical protein BDA96_09G025200 [Sorghum bicolor]OQU77284.1 hypothetical protein SORBI_3009G024166 [Sorghum bicolor]
MAHTCHLFLGCVAARQVWFQVLSQLRQPDLASLGDHELDDWWIIQILRINRTTTPLVDSLLLLTSWSLWKERNARVFRATASTVPDVVVALFVEGAEWASAGFVLRQ